MTTIAEEKAKREEELQNFPLMVRDVRMRVIEAAQLADEMKAVSDTGLSSAYPVISDFYGKQRAVLRGLSDSDVLSFTLPSVAQWTAPTDLAFPSETQFGYIFFDLTGVEDDIDDAYLYYLAKKTEGNILSSIEEDSDAFVAPTALQDFQHVVGLSDGVVTQYQFDLPLVPVPGTVKIYHGDSQIGQDNGSGSLSGTNVAGSSTISYTSPFSVNLEYTTAPAKDTVISLIYDSYTNEAAFSDTYTQVDFTLSTKEYCGETLKLINIAADVLDERPVLLSTMTLRKKSDHQVVGTVLITCEGLQVNSSWNHLTGDPAETMQVSHSDFKTLLGYLEPDIDNDLTKSANPYIASSGKKVGETYPAIEASPFYPCTDGTYQGSDAYTGNYVHIEESVPIWSVHPDIKWQYGTAPSALGETSQENPGTFSAALAALAAYSDYTNNPIPDDTGSSTSAGYSYHMDSGYVMENTWEEDGENPGTYIITSTVEYTCLYNSIHHLRNDELDHIDTQLDKLITLGDVANTAETGRQSGDTQFFTDTSTFRTALDTFLTYHDAFDPLTSRPTYTTTKITDLKTAGAAFSTSFNARVTDLDTVLGTAVTSGYAKVIYDSCNAAVNKDIGYLREVIDELNSIQDVYDMITQKQAEYAKYP